jgi:hypothetical protein
MFKVPCTRIGLSTLPRDRENRKPAKRLSGSFQFLVIFPLSYRR